MLPDLLSAGLRALSFVAMAQAGGAAIFLAVFAARLGASCARIVGAARFAAIAALLLLPAQFGLEAARMAGSLSGIADLELQRLALSSSGAAALAVRMFALVAILVSLVGTSRTWRLAGLLGALVLATSFVLTGHTAMPSAASILGPLLVAHVAIVMFWFGSLLPLVHIAMLESPHRAAALVADFSRVAMVCVPLILLAGAVMSLMLIPDMEALRRPYGLILIGKVAAFLLLLVLAAVNKSRLGPALAAGGPQAIRRFRASLLAEWSVIAAVLSGTAVMTTFFSPD